MNEACSTWASMAVIGGAMFLSFWAGCAVTIAVGDWFKNPRRLL